MREKKHNFHPVRNLQIDYASGSSMLVGWSTDSCKNFFGQVINSDARALQNLLKMQIFDLLRSTLK